MTAERWQTVGLIVETDRLIDRLRDALNSQDRWVGVSDTRTGQLHLGDLLTLAVTLGAVDLADAHVGTIAWVDRQCIPQGDCHVLTLPRSEAVAKLTKFWLARVTGKEESEKKPELVLLTDCKDGHAKLMHLLGSIAIREGGHTMPEPEMN